MHKWLNLYSVLCNWYKLQSPWSFGLGLLFSVFKFFLLYVISLFLAALKRFPKRSSISEEGPSAMLLHGSSWSVLGSCSTGSILSLFPEKIVGRVFSIRFLGNVCRAMLTKHNVIWLNIWHFNLRFWNQSPHLNLVHDLWIQQVLPINQGENYIYGMLAFPLLELGKMADAEKAAKKGFEINQQDYWAQHAVSYLYFSLIKKIHIFISCL